LTPPKIYTTEAIVLKHTNFGEADKIITLYTPNMGKLKALVRGARRSRSKLGGHVEPLIHSSLVLARGRNLDTVTQSQTIESFLSIRNDLWLTARALYLVELADLFTPEHAKNYPVYKLLLNALHELGKVRQSKESASSMQHFMLLRFFEAQLLGHVGYQPQLRDCLNCRSLIQPVENFFSHSGGGILCPSCAHTEPVVQPISVNVLKVMRLLQRGDYATASRLRLAPELSQELERIIQGYVRYLLEREIKATGFLDRLRREGM
jgi:DNA repair protein RecO (recombination protein O)